MGTNEAFGGSGTASWERVREAWAGLGGDASADEDGAGPGGAETAEADASGEASPAASDSAYDVLISAIAQALIGDDPDARRPSLPSVPLSTVLPSRGAGRGDGGAGGGGRSGGASGGGGGGSSSSGSRRVTAQAARGGSAIGAAAAYRDRDADALAGYGLTLEELDALSPRMRCARILDLAIGQAGHPDEQAMRDASVAQVKALVSGDPATASISPLEAVRDFIGELTVRLGLIELRDQYLAKEMTAAESRIREKGLRQWVKAKVARLDLGRYGKVSTTQFHQVAGQMSVDVLRLLRGEA